MIERLKLWWSMFKHLVTGLLIFTTMLCANDRLEIFATRVDSNTTNLIAKDDVIVLYQDHYLSANEAHYDRQNQILELFGNIVAMQGVSYFAMGEYAKINISDESRSFTPFYMSDKSTRVWMSTAKARAQKKDFMLDEGMVSGCDPSAPLWKIYFSSSDYNSETHWMNVYNARLHIYDIPVFYFPYFGYSLDTRRRSGLLTPSFSFSNAEGIFLEQPLYIAVADQWDVELRPQVRTNRGEGLYSTLRFVDSKVAAGSLHAGYFQEKTSYAKEYDLANEKHYGFELNYKNKAPLREWLGLDLEGQSGLYSDIRWMTDVDYLNLTDNDETQNVTSNQIDSKLNFFYSNETDYFGSYFKYFLDLSKQDNDQTIQQLPALHYHHYLDMPFDEYLYYYVDSRVTNFERRERKTAMQGEMTLPITLQTALFDEYLNLNYEANLYGRYITFGGDPIVDNPFVHYRDGTYGRFFQRFSGGTSLTRGYENMAHTIGVDIAFTKSERDVKNGYYDDYETLCAGGSAWNTEVCDYYTLSTIQNALSITMSQYLVAKGEQLLYHRLIQRVVYEEDEERYAELENELELNLGWGIYYYNDTYYNHDRARVTKTLNSIRYHNNALHIDINHLYEDRIELRERVKNSYLTSQFSYQYNKRFQYFGKYSYDFEYAKKKNVEVGFLYSKRCWDFGLRYIENNRPILTNNESASVYDRYIYFTIALKPIGGTSFKYKTSNTLEGT